jgi:TRAP-type C4-dicarboxylate transport system substrate-binding protein
MPVTALPEAMARGTVDGAMTTLEVVPSIKLEELVRFTTEPPEGDRMGTSVFMLAMNKDAYDALPEDLKAVIDANSGVNVAAGIGAQWEGFEQGGIDALAAAGAERIILDEAAAAPFRAASEAVVARWVAEVTAAGIDGQGLVDAARAAVAAAR